MSGATYFIKVNIKPFENTTCDMCGDKIAQVGEGNMYWNPKKRARIVDICEVCYVARKAKQAKRAAEWRAEREKILAETQAAKTEQPALGIAARVSRIVGKVLHKEPKRLPRNPPQKKHD